MAEATGAGVSLKRPASEIVARHEVSRGLELQEQKAWQDVLGARVDIAPLPDYITPDVIKNLKGFGMELRYIPALDLKQEDLQNKDVSDYLEELATLYPNWKPYESLSETDKHNPAVVRNIRKWYWEEIKDNRIDFPVLPGRWAGIEIMEKPEIGDSSARYGGTGYADWPLTIRMNSRGRFGIPWKTGRGFGTFFIKEDGLAQDVGITTDQVNMRYLTTTEWNLLANREGWGKTTTYEWTEDEYRLPTDHHHKPTAHLVIGGSKAGGAASVNGNIDYAEGIGFRYVLIFEP